MSSRNRVIYQSESLFVSENVGSLTKAEHEELIRVQSANYGFTINRTDVNQFGNLARIDSLVLEPPTVNFDFSYYLSNGKNESSLGFSTDPSSQFVSGFLEASSGKNFYIVTSEEGQDAATFENGDSYGLIGIGNAFLSDYTVDLSVGALPTTSVSFEASNINSQNGSIASLGVTGDLPAVNPSDGTIVDGVATLSVPENTGQDGPTALRPGDVVLSFPGFDGGSSESGTLSTLVGAGGFHVQSASLSIPLSRSPISKLGSKFPYARVVDFPVNATMSVNAILNTVEAGNLANMIAGCGGESDKEVAVTLKSCEGDPVMGWTLKGATLDSENWSSSVGSNKAVDLTFGVQIGGIDDVDQGIIFSGAYNPIVLTPSFVYFDTGKTLEAGSISGDIPADWMRSSGTIEGVTFGSSATYIGDNAFNAAAGITEVIIDETQGNNITGIGNYSFYSIRDLENIKIGSNVKNLGVNCFRGAGVAGGKTVTIDVDAENIGGSAFAGDIKTNSITIGDNVKTIGANAFHYINGPATVTIGSNVETIGNTAFQGLTSDNNEYVSVINNSTKLKYIGVSAFINQDMTSFVFNEGLTGIGASAFRTCKFLEEITLPDSLIGLADEAFYNCDLVSGTIDIGTGIKTIGNRAFDSQASVLDLDVTGISIKGTNMTSIGSDCFGGCSAVTGFDIYSDPAPSVGANGLAGLTALASINVPVGSAGYNVAPWTDFTINYTLT